jgi:hypothetical protein
MRRQIGFGCVLLAAAAFAAGCGGGGGLNGGSGMLVPQSPSSLRIRPDGRVAAHLSLTIPPRRRSKRAHYISPDTKSFVAVVTPASGSRSAPPLPRQVLDVGAPACQNVGSPTLPITCAFTILVEPGSDAFVLTAYPAPGGRGSPLSAFSSAGAIAIPASGALSFTLEGIVDHIAIRFGGGTWAPIPIGSPTTAPMTVIPFDAAGDIILAQVSGSGYVPFDKPFTIAMAPASGDITLSNASGSGSKLTYAGPADLATTVTYDGAVHFKGNTIVDTSFALQSSVPQIQRTLRRPNPHQEPTPSPSPTPASAEIDLASNTVVYLVASPAPSSEYPGIGGFVYSTAGKAFYYSVDTGSENDIGTFTLGTNGLSKHKVAVPRYYSNPFVDSYGGIWFLGSDSAYCYSDLSTASPAATIAVAPPGYSATVEALGQDAAKNLWITANNNGEGSAQYGFSVTPESGKCQVGSPSYAGLPFSGYGSAPSLTGVVPASGTPAGIWAADAASSHLFKVTQSGASASPIPVDYGGSGSYDFEGLNEAPDGKIYALTGNQPTATELNTVSAAGALSLVASMPYVTTTSYGGSNSAMSPGLRFAYSDYGGDLILFDKPTGTYLSLSMAATFADGQETFPYCQGQAFDDTGTPWIFCGYPSAATANRVLLTPTWSIFPSSNIPIDLGEYCGSNYELGIGEAMPQNSGPFTATASNGLITPEGPVTGNPHALQLVFSLNDGTSTVTVTDAKGRSQTATFTFTGGIYECGGFRRPHQRPGHGHARAPLNKRA